MIDSSRSIELIRFSFSFSTSAAFAFRSAFGQQTHIEISGNRVDLHFGHFDLTVSEYGDEYRYRSRYNTMYLYLYLYKYTNTNTNFRYRSRYGTVILTSALALGCIRENYSVVGSSKERKILS